MSSIAKHNKKHDVDEIVFWTVVVLFNVIVLTFGII